MLLNAAVPIPSDESHLATPLPAREQRLPWNPEKNRQRFEDWCDAMRKGDFGTAWTINDLERQHWPSAHQLWNGQPLDHASIELEARHGLGDFVQMMRFVPVLNQLGCAVSINVRPELLSIAECFSGRFTTNARWDRQSKHSPLEIMELPYALRLQSKQLPKVTNYLHPPSELRARTRLQMNTRSGVPKIGIVWSGSSWDPERWIPFSRLQPLLGMTCCEWWAIQGGLPTSFASHPHLRHVAGYGDASLVDLAATIQALDLLITVDTLAAHIAGALGVEVWVLLKKHADWRWMQNRSDSPWYPSMRLFRQEDPGDWTGVLSAVQTELGDRYQSSHPATCRAPDHPLVS